MFIFSKMLIFTLIYKYKENSDTPIKVLTYYVENHVHVNMPHTIIVIAI